MNANNVLVNRQRLSVAFIDFQHTGYHNIYRDFVSFESSIRIDWGEAVDIADAEELLQEEIQMCKDGSRRRYKSKYLDKIAIVRDAAFANFPIDGQEHDGGVSGERRYALYLIAAYVHYSWLVSRFWKDWQPAARARLILGAFSSLAALQELRDVG